MSNPRRPAADEALAAYLSLGPSRSLKRLVDFYRAEPGFFPPALRTLKEWSRAHAWQDRAKEHDAQVRGSASAIMIERDAEARVQMSEALEQGVVEIVAEIRRAVRTLKVGSAHDLDVLADVAVKLAGCHLEAQRGQMPTAAGIVQEIRAELFGGDGHQVLPGPGAWNGHLRSDPSIIEATYLEILRDDEERANAEDRDAP